MNNLFVGQVGLSVIGEENFHLETFIAAKLQVVKPDGTTVEFDVMEILHKNLKAIDSETGYEISELVI